MMRVQVFNAHTRYRLHRKKVARYVSRVLKEKRKTSGTISVILIGSRYCRILNRDFLGHDYVTDVISFNLSEGKRLEGEIYINLDQAKKQASDYSVPFYNEVARLAIHGALHLIGFDDATRAGREKMRREEAKQLKYWF